MKNLINVYLLQLPAKICSRTVLNILIKFLPNGPPQNLSLIFKIGPKKKTTANIQNLD